MDPRCPLRRPLKAFLGGFPGHSGRGGLIGNREPAGRANGDVRVGINCFYTYLGPPSQVRGVRARAMERLGG